jgi:hypothetical protein
MLSLFLCLAMLCGGVVGAAAESPDADQEMRSMLDAPLLFTKRHSYTGIHIYDTYYKWPPGGGGIYVLENPAAAREEWRIRALVDATTPGSPGNGIYDDPDLSWDGTRVLFTFKGTPDGSTSIYEIRVDGTGLRQITDPSLTLDAYHGAHGGQHDVYPAYLPDDRIVFLSTRPSSLVPCANTGVSILHVMNNDGSDIHSISVNYVDEFDPAVMPDGRIVFGRWEYIDKNALTIQSLWTMNPDGTQETALYANNMVFPEAILDARPVPGTTLIVGTFAKHNAPPRGAIAIVDPTVGKNNPAAITHLESPDDPLRDTGESCEPWPVTPDVFVFSGRPAGKERNMLEIIDRAGRRIPLLEDPAICLHSPMLIKPRQRPPVIPPVVNREAKTGTFIVQDVYQGLEGVQRGDVKHLRVVEETSRVSSTNMAGSPYNQVSLISAALAWSPKIFHGIVPVEEDGSASFEAPAGRALYLQALDEDGRLVQSMRTFVQAAPGATRSCMGCHETRESTPASQGVIPAAMQHPPKQLQPERWGSGHLDYPGMVQPILDKHCVRCHGGEENIAGGMDLSGGWTEHFSISYENLVSRRQTQLVAHWIAGIDSMNATAFWSSQLFKPRTHGSGAAPLADLLMSGHEDRFPEMTREERDLLMAWMDTNGLFHGTWDATESGCAIPHWNQTREALVGLMRVFDCLPCHGEGETISFFENDWINLQHPEWSRILRAPLSEGDDGHGLAWCRNRKVAPESQRIHLLRGGYGHAVQPVEAYPSYEMAKPDRSGEPVTLFTSTADPRYQAMLTVIRTAAEKALARPRVDMPGAQIIAGACRMFLPPPVPEAAPTPIAIRNAEGLVRIQWEQNSGLIGLEAELHRSDVPDFTPSEATRIARTPLSHYTDVDPAPGQRYYALVIASDTEASRPAYAAAPMEGDAK